MSANNHRFIFVILSHYSDENYGYDDINEDYMVLMKKMGPDNHDDNLYL
jgi:hypothetical protein